MKLHITRIDTETIAVARNGQTVGDMVNAIIADAISRDTEYNTTQITHVAIDVDNEDRAALKLLQSPVFNDTTGPNGETAAESYHRRQTESNRKTMKTRAD